MVMHPAVLLDNDKTLALPSHFSLSADIRLVISLFVLLLVRR